MAALGGGRENLSQALKSSVNQERKSILKDYSLIPTLQKHQGLCGGGKGGL
jgi:hypothetical protein